MHGQLSRGRFLAYGIAERVEWQSVSADGEKLSETVIHGNHNAPNEFTFDGSSSGRRASVNCSVPLIDRGLAERPAR